MNDTRRDYKTIGYDKDWKAECFPIYGEWPLLVLGIVVLQKSKHAVPGSSDLIFFERS